MSEKIKIDGRIYEISNIQNHGYLPMAEMTDGTEWYLTTAEKAKSATIEYWQDMADNDPEELACLIGNETLIQWALGRSAGPGNVYVNSLQEWIQMCGDYPEEQWAQWDGAECEVQRVGHLSTELGFVPEVAYRCN